MDRVHSAGCGAEEWEWRRMVMRRSSRRRRSRSRSAYEELQKRW